MDRESNGERRTYGNKSQGTRDTSFVLDYIWVVSPGFSPLVSPSVRESTRKCLDQDLKEESQDVSSISSDHA